MTRPKIIASAQTPRPKVSSVEPSNPRNCTDDRSGSCSVASLTCAVGPPATPPELAYARLATRSVSRAEPRPTPRLEGGNNLLAIFLSPPEGVLVGFPSGSSTRPILLPILLSSTV